MYRLAALSLLLSVPAQAQDRRAERPASSYWLSMLPVLESVSFDKDLNLTPDQLRKLTDFRQQVWDTYYRTPHKDLPELRDKQVRDAERVFSAVLRPEQAARLREIARQRLDPSLELLGGRNGDLPDIANDLQLTETQKQRLRDSSNLLSLLTAEQRERWHKLLGKPFKGELTAAANPHTARPHNPLHGPASEVPLLRTSAVQEELKLTDEQIAGLRPLLLRATPIAFSPSNPERSTEQENKETAREADEVNKRLAEILQPEQLRRLMQIAIQKGVGRYGPATLLGDERKAAELELSGEQRSRVRTALRARRDGLINLALSEDDVAAVTERIHEIAKALDGKVVAILTPAQQEKLREMFGEPFVEKKDDDPRLQLRRRTFGLYTEELGYLQKNVVHNELKMTAEQIQRAAEAWEKFNDEFSRSPSTTTSEDPPREEKMSNSTAQALGGILKPEQAKRLRELILQRNSLGGRRPVPLDTIVAYPGVPAELGLSARQVERLQGGGSAEQVLTADEKAKAAKLVGEPFSGRLGFVVMPRPRLGTAGPVPAAPARLRLAQDADVQAELKMTDEQVAKVGALEQKRREALRLAGAGDRVALFQQQREADVAALKDLDALLTEKQRERLAQIELQERARGGITLILPNPENMARLGLSREQVTQMMRGQLQLQQIGLVLTREYLGFDSEWQTALRRAQDERALGMLTDEQRKRWESAFGQPFARWKDRPASSTPAIDP
jgi:hypothetical protein